MQPIILRQTYIWQLYTFGCYKTVTSAWSLFQESGGLPHLTLQVDLSLLPETRNGLSTNGQSLFNESGGLQHLTTGRPGPTPKISGRAD
jgi:hypothetical protein